MLNLLYPIIGQQLGLPEIPMNALRLLTTFVVVASLTACVSTDRFAAEYHQPYLLAEDVHLYKSASFTGVHSAWFTGPVSVETICSSRRPAPASGSTIIKKGSPVRVLKIIHVSSMSASSHEAKLELLDRETHVTHEVYIRWPGSKSLLTTAAPNQHP